MTYRALIHGDLLASRALVVLLLLSFCLGCGGGRAMTSEESMEYSTIVVAIEDDHKRLSLLEADVMKRFDAARLGISTDGRICGYTQERLKTGVLNLVYGPKQRIVIRQDKREKRCNTLQLGWEK